MNDSANGLGTSTIKNTSINQLNRSIERALDEAAYTGELNLNGRKLREFPTSSSINTKCDLSDTVIAGEEGVSCDVHRQSTFFFFLRRSFSQSFRGISTTFVLVFLVGTPQSLSQCNQIHPWTNRSNPHVENTRSQVLVLRHLACSLVILFFFV